MARSIDFPARLSARGGPIVMGILNASADSFSGDGRRSVDEVAEIGAAMAEAGAGILDIGGQSSNTKTAEISVEEEIDRIAPLLERLRPMTDALISVDTYRPEVARAALALGADVVNDVSCFLYPEVGTIVAEAGAGYVLTHTQGAPKTKFLDPTFYGDVVDDVTAVLAPRLDQLLGAGVDAGSILLDPGFDLGKTPHQSILALHGLDRFFPGRPLLLALSRKDFIGAVAQVRPSERDPGTLAAVASAVARRRDVVLRVHDADAVLQFLAVLDAIEDPSAVDPALSLPEQLRREA